MTVNWTPGRIRLLMERRGQTVTSFARSMRVTRDAVHRWLRGARTPDAGSVKQLNRLYAGHRRSKGEIDELSTT